MKVGELRDILKPIKNASNIYFINNTIKFSFPNSAVHGIVDIKTNFDKNFMIAYVDNFYKLIDDKTIADNEIVITEDCITDNDESFEFPLYEFEEVDITIPKPSTMYHGLNLSIKLKYEELSFEKNGTFIKSKSKGFKKRINKNRHNVCASVSYTKKLEYLPKKEYDYIIGLSELTLRLVDNFTYYFTVTLDSISDEQTDATIDSYLQDLDFIEVMR